MPCIRWWYDGNDYIKWFGDGRDIDHVVVLVAMLSLVGLVRMLSPAVGGHNYLYAGNEGNDHDNTVADWSDVIGGGDSVQ